MWYSRNGIVAPAYFDVRGSEWLHSFAGGLFTTCGLRQVGQPCVDAGEELGLHGRIANTPAEDVAISESWEDDDFVLAVSGTMRETKVFNEDLRLTRTITTRTITTRTITTRVGWPNSRSSVPRCRLGRHERCK